MYITNFDYPSGSTSPVVKCTVNPDHTLTCTDTGDNYPAFQSAGGIAVNSTGTFANISNYMSSEIIRCAIDALGELNGCAVETTLSSPSIFGITLYY